MNPEMMEWITQIQTQLTSRRNELNARQQRLVEELNTFVTNELIRLSYELDLKFYNDGVKKLRKEIIKRLNEINEGQSSAIAALLGGAFALVFLSHIQLLSRFAGANIIIPESLNLEKAYQGYILGRFYEKALKNVRKGFDKRFIRDSEAIRRQLMDGFVSIDDIFKMRNKAAKDTTGHYLFIDDQELHRVAEAAKYESAVYLKEVHGILTEKFWETREDDRVRDTVKASHVAMQSVTIAGHELFDLVPFGKSYAPANSGIADQDINCRCMAIYNIV